MVLLGGREQIEFIPDPSTGMAPDPGHSGLPAKGLFTVLACPSPDGNLGRGGDGAHGLAEFTQQLPQKGKGEGETLGYGKTTKKQDI